MSCIKETYMEYSIMTTNRCNLNCAYCINSARRSKEPAKKADAPKIISHIMSDARKNGYDPVVITFYGGEPMLETGLLSEVMDGTAGLRPMYNIFTNGTLISRENIGLLNKMHMISVSIDGDSRLHDEVRGKGSYRRTLENFAGVKNDLKANVLAFVTITPRSRLKDSVLNLTGEFDNIFWFLENSPEKEDLAGFLSNYDKDLDILLDCWMKGLKDGKVTGLIPFQGLYDMLEHKHVYTGLPCGIGTNFQAIAIDGSVYSCEDSYHNKLGTVSGGVDMKKSRGDFNFEICVNCEIKNVCAGRCVIPHLNYDKEKVEFYCECSKMLVDKYKRVLPEIKQLVASGIVKESDILNRLTRFTDVMP
ncbi:MAG: radical SAM protein [Elusimicrobiota bacterium]